MRRAKALFILISIMIIIGICYKLFYVESDTSYALCASYWEQQSNSLLNMWSFQKWANHSGGIRVVEPFAGISVLELPRHITKEQDLNRSLRFSDYFDLEFWTNETSTHGIPSLVTWEEFIKYSNRKVVAVILSYEVAPGGVYVGSDIKKHDGCSLQFKQFYGGTAGLLLKVYQFEVVKNICFAFYQLSYFPPLDKFNSHIINGQVQSYWFSYYRGVQSDRITIKETSIERAYGSEASVLSMARPSPRVVRASKAYVRNVLKVDFYDYNAVVFRTNQRKNVMTSHGYSRSDIMDYFFKCASHIHGILETLESKVNFLAIDLGRFGDLTAGNYFDYNSSNIYDGKGTKLFQQVLTAVYGNKTIKEYHQDFVNVADGISDSGYVGIMQKTIAEKSKCLLVIGGHSSFQSSLVNNHKFGCVKHLCYE